MEKFRYTLVLSALKIRFRGRWPIGCLVLSNIKAPVRAFRASGSRCFYTVHAAFSSTSDTEQVQMEWNQPAGLSPGTSSVDVCDITGTSQASCQVLCSQNRPKITLVSRLLV